MNASYRRRVKERVHVPHKPERNIQSRQSDDCAKVGGGVDFSAFIVQPKGASGEIENGRPGYKQKGTRDSRPEGLHMLYGFTSHTNHNKNAVRPRHWDWNRDCVRVAALFELAARERELLLMDPNSLLCVP